MSLQAILFYLFAIVAVFCSIALLISKNVFYAALFLLVGLLSLAGIYVLAFAEFVAVTQIMVYAGGVLVLIVFGIMLTSRNNGQALLVENSKWFSGILTGLIIFSTLVYFIDQESFGSIPSSPVHEKFNNVNQVGIELMTDYLFPFEVAGILLLITLIGAAVTASFKNEKES